MKLKSVLSVLFMTLSVASCAMADDQYKNVNIVQNKAHQNYSNDSRYDYIYEDPPKPSLQAYGRYIFASSGVRYVHSPSKLKRAAHAARVNANNRLYSYD